jgi:hypothetical protein
VNSARVKVYVSLNPQGQATSASPLSDPGHGFAAAARRCALGARYAPALDESGRPTSSHLIITVKFTR